MSLRRSDASMRAYAISRCSERFTPPPPESGQLKLTSGFGMTRGEISAIRGPALSEEPRSPLPMLAARHRIRLVFLPLKPRASRFECVPGSYLDEKHPRPDFRDQFGLESGGIASVLDLLRLAKELGVIQERKERSLALDEGPGSRRLHPRGYMSTARDPRLQVFFGVGRTIAPRVAK
jgi:hypothetical protein